MSAFNAVKLTDRVYWVGAIDWAIRNFHGYETSQGTTYNAFLVLDEKITLIDTVKKPFFQEMMSRISSVVDPGSIDYIVSNHAEMDHSGALPEAIAAICPEKVIASRNGRKALQAHFHWDPETVSTVTTGDTISLGETTLSFIETRMLHWPDSMVSYLSGEKVLFSQDGFGMHLASTERFDDELPLHVLDEEAEKYFANILMPFSPLVTKLMTQLGELDLEIDLLCPDHGPIWREHIGRILGKWSEWALQKPIAKAVIVYDTMWRSTALMADAICNGLSSKGISVRVMPLGSSHMSDVATQMIDAAAMIVGSPTINGQLFPTVASCLTYLGSLKPRNMVGAAFGSYGWSGEAPGKIEKMLEEIGIPLAADPVRINYVPDEESLRQATELGITMADRILELCGDS